MNLLRDVQVQLRTRYRRLHKSTYSTYGQEVAYFVEYVRATPSVSAIVENVERLTASFDPVAWLGENLQRWQLAWPPTEHERARLVWSLMLRWAHGEEPLNIAHDLSTETNHNAALRHMTDVMVEPLIEYFEARLGTESEVLLLLDRYRRRFELFDRDRLHAKYLGDTAHGEAIYDTDLRRFLFDQGIENPFSQPVSTSGKCDIVSGLATDDPLVCEVKLFTGNVPYIAQGLHQAIQYAHDNNKTVAHLVIYNLTEQLLELPTDVPGQWPPRLEVGNVTVFMVAIRALPTGAASKMGKAKPRVISREEMVIQVAV